MTCNYLFIPQIATGLAHMSPYVVLCGIENILGSKGTQLLSEISITSQVLEAVFINSMIQRDHIYTHITNIKGISFHLLHTAVKHRPSQTRLR